jgi:hypothetical protein
MPLDQGPDPRPNRSRFGLLLLAALVLTATAAVAPGAVRDAGHRGDVSGTYLATLPDRAEILTLHRDGTAGMTLSDQVTAGAGGFTFSDSYGSWRRTGRRTIAARMVNLNFDLTGPAATYSGAAVVDYVLELGPGPGRFAASCEGAIYATGIDPLDPASVPDVTFDCAYLDGFLYRRVPPRP